MRQWRYRTAVEVARVLNATAGGREPRLVDAAEETTRSDLSVLDER